MRGGEAPPPLPLPTSTHMIRMMHLMGKRKLTLSVDRLTLNAVTVTQLVRVQSLAAHTPCYYTSLYIYNMYTRCRVTYFATVHKLREAILRFLLRHTDVK